MTTKSDKIRGLLLSALMVMSVFAGAAAFAGTAAANHDEQTNLSEDAAIGNTSPIFQGQVALSTGPEYNSDDNTVDTQWDTETVELRSGSPDGDDTSYEDQLEVHNGHVVFDTSDYEGNYYLIDDNGNYQTFEIVEQRLDVAPDGVDATTGDGSVSIEVADSNRNTFDLNVTADSDDVITTNSGDGQLINDTSEGDTPSISLADDISAGNYTLTVGVEDASASETVELNVTEAAGLDATFTQDVVSQERGDTASITVNLTSTSEADVYVGAEDKNYLQKIDVSDEDDDNQVTVLFNTFSTGTSDGDNYEYVDAAGDDSASINESYDVMDVSNPLASGTYPLNVTEDGNPSNELDVATLSIDQRSADGASSWVAPGNSISSSAGPSDVTSVISESDTVAQGDTEVVEVSASGIYGAVETASADSVQDINGLSLDVTQVNPGPNVEAESFNSSAEGVNTVFDAENNTFYVLIDTDDVNYTADSETETLSEGEWNATFSVTGENYSVASADETASAVFEVQQPTVELNGGNDITVPNAEHNISGTSNLAPGTSLTVEARAGGEFLKTQSVEVGPEGNFEAAFDFSDVSNGTEFSVNTRQGYDDGISGVVDESYEPEDGTEETTEPTETTTTETTTETTTTETTTTTEDTTEMTDTTETTTPGDNDGGIPGFGVSVALVAIIAAALLALRRSN